MFIPATEPTLVADKANKWTQIGEEYFQTDNNKSITLEIRHIESGLFRWWLYDDKSVTPDMAVTFNDKPTLAEALADAYDYLKGYKK